MISLVDDVRLGPKTAARAAYHPDGFVWEYDEREDQAHWFAWEVTGLERLPALWSQGLRQPLWRRNEVDVRDVPTSVFAGWRHFARCRCRDCRSGIDLSDSRGQTWRR
jgi:hypothetical protein